MTAPKTPPRDTNRSGKRRSDKMPSVVDQRRIFQFIPLLVSDGNRKAVLSLAQSDELAQFVASPETAPPIDTEDRSIRTLPLEALSRENVLVPSAAAMIGVDLSVSQFIRLTSQREIEALDRVWTVQLNPVALSRLLAGRRAILLATDRTNVALLRVRIVKDGRLDTAPLPAVDEIMVRRSDLPRFLDEPLVPGTLKKPYRVDFTQKQAKDFLEFGAVTLDVGQGRALSLVVVPDDMTEVQSGLSFRRDLWSPLRTTRTLGVMSRGDLASAKAIEEAAKEDFDVLIERMKMSLGFESSASMLKDQQQIGLIVPWDLSIEIEDNIVGQRVSTDTLLPGEKRQCRIDEADTPSAANHDRNVPEFLGAPLTVEVGGEQLYIKSLDSSLNEFGRSLMKEALSEEAFSSAHSIDTPSISRFANPSKTAVMQVDSFRAYNTASVSVAADTATAQIGVFLPNPFLTLSFDMNTVLRYSAVLADNLTDTRLRPGFEALGALSARRDVVRLNKQVPTAKTHPDAEMVSAEGARPQVASASTAEKTEQIGRLTTQARASLGRVQNLARQVLDSDHQDGALRAFATMGNSNAADVLRVPVGSARSEDILAARKWLADRVLFRRFQAVYCSLAGLIDADLSSESAVLEWGERFLSAVPTHMEMFELVNISNESLGIIREVLRPLVRAVALNGNDLESWWQRLSTVGLLSPEDVGLTRAIERFVTNYNALMDVDAERAYHSDPNRQDLRLARQLLRHIRDNADHYAGVIFLNQPRRAQISLMQSLVQNVAPNIPGQAFNFDRIWIVGQSVVLGLNEAEFEAATVLIEKLTSIDKIAQSRTSVVPVFGLTQRSTFIEIPEFDD